MDAAEFVKEEIRMCASYQNCTTDCPLYDAVYCSVYPKERTQEEAVEIVRRVEEWSTANPRKTRQDAFLEQWPDAKLKSNGVLDIKPCTVEKSMVCCMACTECYEHFWLQGVK